MESAKNDSRNQQIEDDWSDYYADRIQEGFGPPSAEVAFKNGWFKGHWAGVMEDSM